MIEELIRKITLSDRRSIAKALTIVESTTESDQSLTRDLISKLFDHQNEKTKVIGFSGITDSGKSSLIEEIGKTLLEKNKKDCRSRDRSIFSCSWRKHSWR